MMKIENIVNDVVLIVLFNHEPLKELGLTDSKIYAYVVGYDENGVWVKHPNFPLPSPPGLKAKKNPKKAKTVVASILIPWIYISSIVHFPGVEGFDFESPFEINVGFNIEEE
ncbi:MAG: hypothetical protein V3S22_03840 [Candidatus Neomarinimicrobiota bacterium]